MVRRHFWLSREEKGTRRTACPRLPGKEEPTSATTVLPYREKVTQLLVLNLSPPLGIAHVIHSTCRLSDAMEPQLARLVCN